MAIDIEFSITLTAIQVTVTGPDGILGQNTFYYDTTPGPRDMADLGIRIGMQYGRYDLGTVTTIYPNHC